MIEERYVEVGNPAYHPRAMIKILFYGYLKGYFGGRPLARQYATDLGLRYLSNDDFPDYRTINLFRINFKDAIANIFAQVVMLCNELGIIGFENLAIDSQKLKANANIFQNKNLDGIWKEKKRIEEQLKKLLEMKIESPEDIEKKEKKEKKLKRRKKKLESAAKLLKEAGGEEDKKMRYNLSDPGSKVMTDKRGVKNPDYLCQNAVDDKHGILTAVKVTSDSTDKDELFPMKEESKKNTGQTHKNTSADCGYSDKQKYKEMESDKETEYYIPDRTKHSSKNDKFSKWNFIYDGEKDVYICPNNTELVFVRKSKDSKGLEYRLYQGVECATCPLRNACMKIRKNKKKTDNLACRTISENFEKP
ncbi:MAG: transposase [Thermoplasmata archaeon]|nr:transposase [Thermoplasmata archaeon]